VLREERGQGAVMLIDGVRYSASCRDDGRTRVVTIDGRERLRIHGTRVFPVGRQATRMPASPADARTRELPAAKADLAGNYALYAAVLLRRMRWSPVRVRPDLYGTRPIYRVELDDRPRVELFVDRRTLQPLAARYRSQRIDGASRLLARVPGSGRALTAAGTRGC
jgi:hypothetical protein